MSTYPAHATRHALAKIARMAACAPAGLPFLRGIEDTARRALGDPTGELDADLAAAAALLAALAAYADRVEDAARILTELDAQAQLSDDLRDLAAGLRISAD